MTEDITKFSDSSRQAVYKAAKVTKDSNVIEILDSCEEDLPGPGYGFHRKCYQNHYTHSKTLAKISLGERGSSTDQSNQVDESQSQSRMSTRKTDRRGIN